MAWLNRINHLQNELRSHDQCERLCQRLDRLIDPLERLEHTSSQVVRGETREILDQFLRCVDDCNEYLERNPSMDPDIFEQFHQRLTHLTEDLMFGLTVQQVFDRQADLENLEKKFHQQKKDFDQILTQRFQSFHRELVNQSKVKPQFLQIPLKDLQMDDKPFARGGFADVYRGIWLTHHDPVAIKVLRLHHRSTSIEEDFYREISTMYQIRYEHILTFLGVCIDVDFYAIVTELMPLGSLYDVLNGKTTEHIQFDWNDRYSLACQMAKGINYMHSLHPPILHRDIKSMNFLLKYDGQAQRKYLVKVCDFGLAEIHQDILVQSFQFVGSLAWKAPELFVAYGQHTTQTDVYSLGVVFWELASEQRPWYEYNDDAMILIQVQSGRRPMIPPYVPRKYQQWIEECWHENPQQRPSCSQLVERITREMSDERSDFSLTRTSIETTEDRPKRNSMSILDSGISSDSLSEIFSHSTTTTGVPIYRIEKRRPLHRK